MWIDIGIGACGAIAFISGVGLCTMTVLLILNIRAGLMRDWRVQLGFLPTINKRLWFHCECGACGQHSHWL